VRVYSHRESEREQGYKKVESEQTTQF
jgi:hypothetical protein